MAEEIVEVVIKPDGRVEIHVKGIAGMDCVEVTKGLEELLGGDLEYQELTQEAYEGISEEQRRQQWT